MSSSARVSASGFSFAMTATLCMITPFLALDPAHARYAVARRHQDTPVRAARKTRISDRTVLAVVRSLRNGNRATVRPIHR